MKTKMMSAEEIAGITGISVVTIRTYLDGYRFADFRYKHKYKNHVKNMYKFNWKFAYALSEYLTKLGKYKAVNNLEEYCEGVANGSK